MAMTAVKIPPTWKDDLVTLRDSFEEEQGAEVVSAIAALSATETGQELLVQLPALAEVLRERPRLTLEAIAAVAEGETPTAVADVASTALPAPTVGGRPVPSCIAGMVAELVELAYHNPQAARKVLQEAIDGRVEPAATMPTAGVKFRLTNPYLASDRFDWDNGRSIKIPVDQPVGPWPEADVAKLESAIAARPKTAPGGRPTAQGATVLVRL